MRFGVSSRDQLGGSSDADMKHSQIQAQKYNAYLGKLKFWIIIYKRQMVMNTKDLLF